MSRHWTTWPQSATSRAYWLFHHPAAECGSPTLYVPPPEIFLQVEGRLFLDQVAGTREGKEEQVDLPP